MLIPYRIYHDPPALEALQALTPIQQMMLSCWYTRHHDGFLRQRHLDQVIGVPLPWVTPFVVALSGEELVEPWVVVAEAHVVVAGDGVEALPSLSYVWLAVLPAGEVVEVLAHAHYCTRSLQRPASRS